MRAFILDFERSPGDRRAWGTILLAVGAIVGTWVALEYGAVSDELARWEGKLSDTRRLAKRSLPSFNVDEAPSAALAQELKDANVVLERLTLRWDELFSDIEGAVVPDVALLGVQPDVRGRLVVLEGETRDLKALLTFLARLEAAPGLADVHLKRHEIRLTDASRPIAFTIQAKWAPQP
jgi:Tfp pilus assembly protein PilN